MKKKAEAVATAQLKHELVKHLRDIPIASYACKRIGVPKATYYKWRKIDRVFCEASDEAIIAGRLSLNDVAKSQLVKLIKEGDFRSISFWLKNNDPDFGSKLTLKIEDTVRKYDPAELKLLETAMRNAGLVGVTLAHQKMAEAFKRSVEKEEARNNELETYEDANATVENTDVEIVQEERKLNIREYLKRQAEKKKPNE